MDADGNLDHDIDDLENYASDASENDDIIDDDQELLALLRGEHAALRDPASSSTEINHAVSPSTLNQATTTIQTLPQEPKALSDILLLDQRRRQQQEEQQQGTRAKPSALRALSEALERDRDITGYSRLVSSSSVFLGAPIAADTIPAKGTSALQETHLTLSTPDYNDYITSSVDEDSVLDEPPAPIISLEDNIALTNVIRTQATQSLAINRMYQDLLVKHLQEVSIARTRNRALHAQFQDIIQMQEGGQDAPVLPTTTTRLTAPYFVDQNGEVPPENEDILKRTRRTHIDPGTQKRWTERERENLRAGVISENKRILFETFSEAGDVDGIRALNSVSDAEMMVNTKGLDWSRISQRFVDTRTAKECLIQWTGMDHPGISKADWSTEEIALLEELAKKHQERNWIQIALDLGSNRTSAQCFKKYMSRKATKNLSKESWSEQEDGLLSDAVQLLGEKNWQQISHCFDNRSAAQCMYRWTKSINPAIRRGRWTKEEDQALRIASLMHGESFWTKVRHHILGRTDVQCRERYMNVLSPNVKSGPWTKEEIEKLVELVEVDGITRWTDVALKMQGRTDNQCSRRYKMICKEKEAMSRKYITSRRRKGRTTLALDMTEAELEIAQRIQRVRDKTAARLKRTVVMDRVKRAQGRELLADYYSFAERHRRVYDLWDERWGKFLDPIEKVFNLGVPPTTRLRDVKEEAQAPSVLNPKVPEPASVLRPGRIRPVPPCFATLNAFSRNIAQGEYLDGRFRLRNVISNGNVVVQPLTTAPLSSEEMNRPEYKELADRFDAMFLWPMMMGMLHMGAARELVRTPAQILLENGVSPPLERLALSTPSVTSTDDMISSSESPTGKRKSQQVDASSSAQASASASPAKRRKKDTQDV